MPVGLSPDAALQTFFKSSAISFRYPTVSTILWPTNTAENGGSMGGSGVIYAIFHKQNVKYQPRSLRETISLKPKCLPRIRRDGQ